VDYDERGYPRPAGRQRQKVLNNTEFTNDPARRIALSLATAFLLITMTAVTLNLAAAIALTLSLAVLAAAAAMLNRAIRGDGHGYLRPPRSHADEETRAVTLARLAR